MTCEAETILPPSGKNVTQKTEPGWLSDFLMSLVAFASQTVTLPSFKPEVTRLPSGENVTEKTVSVCPHSGSTKPCLVPARMVVSLDPEVTLLSLGEK